MPDTMQATEISRHFKNMGETVRLVLIKRLPQEILTPKHCLTTSTLDTSQQGRDAVFLVVGEALAKTRLCSAQNLAQKTIAIRHVFRA